MESSSAAGLQPEFTCRVHRCFETLRSRGMPPNEACALALKVASGVAALPPTQQEVVQQLRDSSTSSTDPSMALLVRQFLSNPDAMFAAFWPATQNPPAATTAATDAAGGSGSSSSSRWEAAAGGSGSSSSRGEAAGGSSSSSTQAGKAPADRAAAAAGDLGTTIGGQHEQQQQQLQQQQQQQQQLQQEQQPAAAEAASSSQQQPPQQPPHASWGPSSRNSSSSSSSSSIDLDAVHSLYQAITSCRCPGVADAAVKAAAALVDHIASTSGRNLHNPGLQRQMAALLLSPLLEEPEHYWMVGRMVQVLVSLPPGPKGEMAALLASWRAQDMRVLLITLQQYITVTLYTQRQLSFGVEAATHLLGMLAAANDVTCNLDHFEFYNDALNNEDFNVKEDFRRWKVGPPLFSFCNYSFVYDPASKARIMQLENACAQYEEFQSSVLQAVFSNGTMSPYFVLRVRRGEDLLRDTLIQVNNAKQDGSLRKPLKVKFIGEEGVDEGGVQKEFFQLLVRQCFNPDFGMFTYDEERHLHWFAHSQLLDLENEYELIGILIGLAIYNSHILEFQFPMVLYRKLLDMPLGLGDLAELQPDVARSLQLLLGMTAGEVEALDLTFQVDTEVGFGEVASIELLPGGATTQVTPANRQQYVSLYCRHLLEDSIQRQFAAFKQGFHRLCSGAALKMFRPPELEALVCGGRVLDMQALQGATHYDDGYTAAHPVVEWFWEVVHAFSDTQKKRLLFFITGSDRVPIKGLAHVTPPFVISRNGPHSERLPTAHTCFNHLLLPSYKDKETLKQRLLLAIENAEGFGLL